MSPLSDANLVMRAYSATGITTADWDVLTSQVEIEGTPITGLALKVLVSTGLGVSPHLTIELFGTTTTTAPTTVVGAGSANRLVAARYFLPLASVADEALEYIIPFVDTEIRALKCMVQMEGTSATGNAPSILHVGVEIVQNVGGDWSRAVNFH